MGKNINEIDDTAVILSDKYITYSVFLRFCLPKVFPVPFARKLVRMPRLRPFLMIGQG